MTTVATEKRKRAATKEWAEKARKLGTLPYPAIGAAPASSDPKKKWRLETPSLAMTPCYLNSRGMSNLVPLPRPLTLEV